MAIGNYLTTEEVAGELNVSPGRVRQFACREQLLPDKKIGTQLFFLRAKVEKFKNTPRNTGRPPASKKSKKQA